MEINYKDHYTSDYFTGKKTYTDHEGKTQTYHGPSLAWEGFQPIANALAGLLPKGTLLDIGCSGGDLARYLQRKGFDPYGVEISEYAIQNCVPEMKGRIALVDITEIPKMLFPYDKNFAWGDERALEPFPDQFDTVIATDLLEHIYQEDLDKTFDWILRKTEEWLFFCVATVDENPHKAEFVAKKGEPIPKEYEATAVSGHVNVRTFRWWVKFFESKNLEIDYKRMYLFQIKREMDKAWRDTAGWNMTTTFFLRKKDA